MPQPYELHVHPPPNYLKRFFFLLSAFISIVFYNTLDLVQEFERRHRDTQVRPPIDAFEVTSTPSVEANPCASTPHGSGSAQFRPSGLGTFHECLASVDYYVAGIADPVTLLRGIQNPAPSTTSSAVSSKTPSAMITAPLPASFSQ